MVGVSFQLLWAFGFSAGYIRHLFPVIANTFPENVPITFPRPALFHK